MPRSRAITLPLISCVLLIQAVIFFYLALNRFIAPDEGFYLYAAKLITQGKTLYHDFFFPQMPLVPYVYAAWFKLFGFSWEAARIFTALLSSVLGALIFLHLRALFGLTVASIGTLVFATHHMAFQWYSTAPNLLYFNTSLICGLFCNCTPWKAKLNSTNDNCRLFTWALN